jgi:YVTN family beta-propeller protein
MKQLIITAILIFIISVSCSKEEILIDNSILDAAFIIQREENSLEMLDFKNNNLTFTPIELGTYIGKIDLIKKFRGKYYMLGQSGSRILVLENINATSIIEIDFGYANLIVKDMCFPNATDCYVVDKITPIVKIIDLTTNQLTNIEIQLPAAGSSIAGIGNQVYVTIPSKDLVVVIDTRTNSIVEQISIAGKPSIVDFSYNGRFAIVVSIGDGKEPPYNQATPAMLTTIDLETRRILKNNILTGREETASKLIPNAMVVTDKYVYISAINIDGDAGGYRISATNYTTTNMIVRNSCNNIIKNWNNVLFITKNTEQQLNCLLYNSNTNKIVADINIDKFNSACEK